LIDRDHRSNLEVVMNVSVVWSKLTAPLRRPIFAELLGSKRENSKRAHKAEMQQWENEGGQLEPVPEAADSRVTTGSA
jgi:hypothetical protein